MSRIKRIYVVSITDEHGHGFWYEVGRNNVHEIRDNSIDVENVAAHRVYEVFTKGPRKIASIENAPVIVEYFEEK